MSIRRLGSKSSSHRPALCADRASLPTARARIQGWGCTRAQITFFSPTHFCRADGHKILLIYYGGSRIYFKSHQMGGGGGSVFWGGPANTRELFCFSVPGYMRREQKSEREDRTQALKQWPALKQRHATVAEAIAVVFRGSTTLSGRVQRCMLFGSVGSHHQVPPHCRRRNHAFMPELQRRPAASRLSSLPRSGCALHSGFHA